MRAVGAQRRVEQRTYPRQLLRARLQRAVSHREHVDRAHARARGPLARKLDKRRQRHGGALRVVLKLGCVERGDDLPRAPGEVAVVGRLEAGLHAAVVPVEGVARHVRLGDQVGQARAGEPLGVDQSQHRARQPLTLTLGDELAREAHARGELAGGRAACVADGLAGWHQRSISILEYQ